MGVRTKTNRGFTLIELMIVVAIVGILAAIAVPMFMDAIRRSRTTEAQLQLSKISKRATEEYQTNSAYPVANVALTPAADCCTQNAGNKRRCAVTPADWGTPEWQMLDFSMSKEFLFQYSYRSTAGGEAYQALAIGDLDCDGTAVTYQLDGTSLSGSPTSTLTEPPSGSD